MEDKEQNGQQNQNQGPQQEGKENEGFAKHPMDNRAMDEDGGGAVLKAPPFALKVNNFPFTSTADQLNELIEDLRTGEEDNYYKLKNLVQTVPQDQLQEMVKVYKSKHKKDLLNHIYQVCGRFPTIYNSSGRHVLPAIGAHFAPNPLSSEAAPGEKGSMKLRSGSDLLPGADVNQVRNGKSGKENYGVRVDIDGQYAINGKETQFLFEQERDVEMDEKKGTGKYPRLVALNLTDDKNESRFKRYAQDDHFGARQSIAMTPWKSGTFQIQYWIRHPEGHVEVMRRSIVVKSAKDVSKKALGNTKAVGFQELTEQLNAEQHDRAGGLHADQHSVAEKEGDPFIKTNSPNPVRLNLGNMSNDVSPTEYKVHGMGENGNSIRWYVRMTYGKNATIPKNIGLRATTPVAADDRPWTQAGENDRVVRLNNQSGNTFNYKLFDAEQYAVIAEEYTPNGKRTGKTAIYRHAVLDPSQTESLEKLEKHQGKVQEYGGMIAEGKQIPVRTALTNNDGGGSTVLSLFVGPSKEDPGELVLVDLTPGATVQEFHGSTIEECFADFDSKNTYPPGHISFQVEENKHGVPAKSWDMDTDGASFLEKTSSVSGWASLGLAGLGALATVVPGAQPAAPFLFGGSALMSATSGVSSLLNRADKSSFNFLGAAVDVAGIAASFMNIGALGKSMSKVAVPQPGGKLFIKYAVKAEVAEGLLITADALAQLNGILDMEMEDGEKERMLATWVGNMILTGALTSHSVREMKDLKARTKRTPGGESDNPNVDASRDRQEPNPSREEPNRVMNNDEAVAGPKGSENHNKPEVSESAEIKMPDSTANESAPPLDSASIAKAEKICDDLGAEFFDKSPENVETIGRFLERNPDKEQLLRSTLQGTFYQQEIVDAIAKFDSIPRIKSSKDLDNVLSSVTDVNTVGELGEKGIQSLYRGSTVESDGSMFQGNPNSQRNGLSTSVDPVRATIFGIESATLTGKPGVLVITPVSAMNDTPLSSPNRRVQMELEVIVNVGSQNQVSKVDQLMEMSTVTMTTEEARELVKEVFAIDIPKSIDQNMSTNMLENLKAPTLEEVEVFYQKALEKYGKK